MRRIAIPLLALVDFALLAGLLFLWVDPSGQVRDFHWSPPNPTPLNISALSPVDEGRTKEGEGQFIAILERPIFSPIRRQPPPPPPPAPPPPPDPFASVQLYGIFAGSADAGIFARIDGKVRRVKLNENIGAWTLKTVDNRDATFERESETRVLKLVHVRHSEPPKSVPVPGASGPTGNQAPSTNLSAIQKMQEEERERLRLRNELRAKAGVPLITQ